MANKRVLYPLRGVNFQEPVLVALAFTPDTNTTYPHNVTMVNSASNFAGASVVKTAAGTYVVEFTDTQHLMVAALADTNGAPLTNGSSLLKVNAGAYVVNASNAVVPSQITLELVTNAGAVAEPSSVPAGTTVCLLCVFKATSTPT